MNNRQVNIDQRIVDALLKNDVEVVTTLVGHTRRRDHAQTALRRIEAAFPIEQRADVVDKIVNQSLSRYFMHRPEQRVEFINTALDLTTAVGVDGLALPFVLRFDIYTRRWCRDARRDGMSTEGRLLMNSQLRGFQTLPLYRGDQIEYNVELLKLLSNPELVERGSLTKNTLIGTTIVKLLKWPMRHAVLNQDMIKAIRTIKWIVRVHPGWLAMGAVGKPFQRADEVMLLIRGLSELNDKDEPDWGQFGHVNQGTDVKVSVHFKDVLAIFAMSLSALDPAMLSAMSETTAMQVQKTIERFDQVDTECPGLSSIGTYRALRVAEGLVKQVIYFHR